MKWFDTLSSIDKASSIFLEINETNTNFYKENETITLPVGFNTLTTKFLKNTPPSYDEIEYAINYIEDEIEKVVSKIPKRSVYIKDHFVKNIALACGIQESDIMKLSVDEMELLFGQYAEVAVGRVPSGFQSDLSPLFYAKLVILREYMHHLDIKYIKII